MNGPASTPFVSVIMPVRNEADFIERSVGAALGQEWPEDRLEIVVADGLSDDGTLQILERMAAAEPRLRVIANPHGIVAPGLNLAIAEARGEVVIRVDGHCEIEPTYVKRCVEVIGRHRAEDGDLLLGVGGPIETVGKTWVARAIAAGMSSLFGVGGSDFRVGSKTERSVDTVAFPGYPRATLDAVGPFDEELVRNQDDEYNYRLREAGGKVVLSPDIRSKYHSRSSLSSLWRQYFQYGMWKVRVMQKHPRQMKARQFVPALFVLALFKTLIAGFIMPPVWIFFALVAGSYLVVNLAASIAVSFKRGLPLLPALPAVFAILHFAYGFGFLWGIVRFALRWGDRTTLVGGERIMVGEG